MLDTLHNPERDRVIRLESPEAYHAWLSSLTRGRERGGSWEGGSFAENMQQLDQGNLALADDAQRILEKFQNSNVFTSGIPQLQACPAGFAPNVPAYLSNRPDCMFTFGMSENVSNRSPLTIYVESTVSGGTSHAQIVNRGVAVLAFVMAMQAIRPVALYTINCLGGAQGCYGSITKIETSPLDLPRAAYMLTSPGYARCLGFSGAQGIEGSRSVGAWPWNSYPTDAAYEPAMRAMCAMEPQDLFLCGMFLLDQKALTNPVAWVQDMVAKHSGQEVS